MEMKLPRLALLRLGEYKDSYLDLLLYLTCGLPFLRILPIPSDMQPYAFFVALVYLYTKRKALALTHFHEIVFWPMMVAVLVAVFDICFDRTLTFMMLVRKTYNYAAIFVISLALFNSFRLSKGIRENWVKGLILLWLFVGLVQKFIDRQFLSFLVSNFRTTENRGVVSLASEPSFYGYVMVFFFVLASEFKRHRVIYQALCVFQIVALGQSAVAVVYLAVFAGFFILKEIVDLRKDNRERRKKKIIIGVIGLAFIITGILVVVKTMATSRMVQVFVKLINNLGKVRSLEDLYALDESVAERVESIVIAFQGFFRNWGLPNGFGEIDLNGVVYGRVMSGFGSVIYELGIVGIIIVVVTSWALIKGMKNGFVFGGSIIIIMFSAIQFGSPIFALLLASALYAQGRTEKITVDAEAHVKQIVRKLRPKGRENDDEDDSQHSDDLL